MKTIATNDHMVQIFHNHGFLPPSAHRREALVMNGTGFLTGGKSFLTFNQQRQRTEGNAKHHHHHNQVSRCQKRTFGLYGAREN